MVQPLPLIGLFAPRRSWCGLLLLCACTSPPPPPSANDRNEPSADAGSVCDPSRCEGCCDEAGVCRRGDLDDRCGQGGSSCTNCSVAGGHCHAGQCRSPGCGDGEKSRTEACDGLELGAATCQSLGFADGELRCSSACELDLSQCRALTCELAAGRPDDLPCSFCSADGTAEIRCGYCRSRPGDPPAADATLPCQSGERCFTWYSAEEAGLVHGCAAEPPELCDFNDGYCDGGVATLCVRGRIDRTDCGAVGQRCVVSEGRFGQGTFCVDPGSRACSSEDFVEACDGEARILCDALTGHTTQERCPPEQRCEQVGPRALCLPVDAVPCVPSAFAPRCDGADRVVCEPLIHSAPELGGREVLEPCGPRTCAVTGVGPRCVQAGTRACDPQREAPYCDGARLVSCANAAAWQSFEDCAQQGSPSGPMGCFALSAGAGCAPPLFQPCDPNTTAPSCDDGVASRCEAPGWLRSEPCQAPNPACVLTPGRSSCAAPGPVPCVFEVGASESGLDAYGAPVAWTPLRCLGNDHVVACAQQSGHEVVLRCPVGAACIPMPPFAPNLAATCR